MSVCPYYLRGYCRYDNRCRMSHVHNQYEPPQQYGPRRPQINSDYRYDAQSANNRHQHASNRNTTEKHDLKYSVVFNWIIQNFGRNKKKALDILEQLQTESRVWHKSTHLWKFTSKSLFPGGTPLPDWHDQSFEEIRWAYRQMAAEKQDHVYTKAWFDYITTIDRQLVGLATLRLETLNSLKQYIEQFIASDRQPSKTLPTDIEMQDVNDNRSFNVIPQTQTTHYTPDDLLLADERAAFESDEFEFGQIPMHAPSRHFS